MSNAKPTLQSANWAMTGFLEATLDLLQNDRTASELRLYFYAITRAGWRELSAAAGAWTSAVAGRSITAYVGTDHAITDPAALYTMRDEGVSVRILRRYNGVYHPKVVWFFEAGVGHLLVGSNNLTLDGLKSNIEFATLTRLETPDANLDAWHNAVHAASDPIADDLLEGYSSERESFAKARAAAKVAGTFTWSNRSSAGIPRSRILAPPATVAAGVAGRGSAVADSAIPAPPSTAPAALNSLRTPISGDLIVEIMQLETGTGGNQIQIPMRAARSFFGLGTNRQARVEVSLRNVVTGEVRELTITRFSNATARLVLRELDYRDRPCVVHFRATGTAAFDFEIICQFIDPTQYRSLLASCGGPTRSGSRRWIHIP